MASLIKGLLGGGGGPENEPSGTEIIEKLKNRVVSSTQLEDRRDAVRAIKALAKKYKNEVGNLCIEVLLNVLRNDKDAELIGYTVESFLSVTEIDQPGGGEIEKRPEIRFSEEIVKNVENITLLLSLLEEFDFSIRRPTTLLLWVLLRNQRKEMQEAVLVIPMGISRIMDLLLDSREVIRNDAILLLGELTASNKQIQKIVAFENAFDRLLSIVHEEGHCEGGIVVEDCIKVLLNLLHGNNSNQAYFRETNLLGQLVPFFDIKDGGNWSPQKVDNVLQMQRLIRTLISPNNPQQSTISCQKLILQSQLLKSLCMFMFASGVPSEVLTDTITTVAEAIRGCEPCQAYFESVSAPATPPRSAVLAILMSMATDKQPVTLRLSALYCFLSYVHKNETGQGNVISTLLPSSTQPTSISPGHVLITGLFGTDPLANWITAIAIANSLNDGLKAQLLRVQLSVQGGSQVSLLQQITMFLSQQSDLRVQTRIGMLTLLCMWLADFSMGITQFLNDTTNVPFLIGQLEQNYTDELGQLSRCLCATLLGISLAFNRGASSEYNQNTLRQIIEHRIGKDAFVECLHHISSSEFFTRAAKHPRNCAATLSELCFDHSFTVFFKQVSDTIVHSLEADFVPPQHQNATQSQSNGSVNNADTSIEDHDSIVNQYKELIRDQDEELTSLRDKYSALEKLRDGDARALKEQTETIKVLQEQASMLASLKDSETDGGESGDRSGEIEALKNTITSMQRVQDSTRQELANRDVTIARMEEDVAKLSTLQADLAQARDENEALLTYSKDMQNEIEQLQEKLRMAATQVAQVQQQQVPPTNPQWEEERGRLQEKVRQLETNLAEVTKKLEIALTQVQQAPPPQDQFKVQRLEAKLTDTSQQLQNSQAQNIQLDSKLAEAMKQLQITQSENRQLQQQQKQAQPAISDGDRAQLEQKIRVLEASLAEVSEKKQLIETEQEDLLVLLAENDMTIKKYKALLIEKGIEVPEEESGSEEEDDDEEEEEGEGQEVD